jgi:tyrosyl-tRNA synthetase
MTSPYAFYQFWLNADDADVIRYLKVFSFRSHDEIEDLERAVAEHPAAREAQRALAEEVTALVHGSDAMAKVVSASLALFGRGSLADLDEGTLSAALAELPRASGGPGDLVVDLMAASGLVSSKGAARRAMAEGGAYLNNVKVQDEAAALRPEDLLHGRWAILRRGKRTLAAVDAAL